MGYYIQTSSHFDKAADLVRDGAEVVEIKKGEAPGYLSAMPSNKALVCVMDNGPFEAAGLCFDAGEAEAFDGPTDTRPRKWLVMDKARAHELSGYTESNSAGS